MGALVLRPIVTIVLGLFVFFYIGQQCVLLRNSRDFPHSSINTEIRDRLSRSFLFIEPPAENGSSYYVYCNYTRNTNHVQDPNLDHTQTQNSINETCKPKHLPLFTTRFQKEQPENFTVVELDDFGAGKENLVMVTILGGGGGNQNLAMFFISNQEPVSGRAPNNPLNYTREGWRNPLRFFIAHKNIDYGMSVGMSVVENLARPGPEEVTMMMNSYLHTHIQDLDGWRLTFSPSYLVTKNRLDSSRTVWDVVNASITIVTAISLVFGVFWLCGKFRDGELIFAQPSLVDES